MKVFEIAGRPIGPGEGALLVAEVGQAHDGSLGMAHAFIDAIAQTGVDAVKFQTHIASAESTPAEAFRVQFAWQDETRYEYWRRTEFDESQWRGLAEHARERKLIFLSSPFSVEAVDLLARVGVAAWKIPSGEITNAPMLDRIAQTGLPVLLSTGMSPWAEIDLTVDALRGHGLPFLVLQSTTAYPCPPEKVGLNVLSLFRERYRCPVGLSDHSGTLFPSLAAAALGVELLEVHITLSREMFGPDVRASLTTGELRQLVEGVRFIEAVRAHPVNKDTLAGELSGYRRLFFKSIVPAMDLPAGTILQDFHLAMKKTGSGVPAQHARALLGRRLRRSVRAEEPLREDDVEEVRSEA